MRFFDKLKLQEDAFRYSYTTLSLHYYVNIGQNTTGTRIV